METFENIKTWQNLVFLGFLLLVIYWVIKLLSYFIARLARKNVTNKIIVAYFNKTLLIFKPIAILLLLLNFISINFITHSLLLAIVAVFGYKHINNYINGIIIKINPLIGKGTLLEIGEYQGEIKQMLPFGMVVSTETGERFINYSEIESKGFAVKSNETSLLRQTLFLQTELSKDDILDLLFENPILNNEEYPAVKATEKEKQYKLQYSLESGASSEDLMAFLNEKNINTTQTINKSN